MQPRLSAGGCNTDKEGRGIALEMTHHPRSSAQRQGLGLKARCRFPHGLRHSSSRNRICKVKPCCSSRIVLRMSMSSAPVSAKFAFSSRFRFPEGSNGLSMHSWKVARISTGTASRSRGMDMKIRVKKSSSAGLLDIYLLRAFLPPLAIGAAAFTSIAVSIGVGPEVIFMVEKLGITWHSIILIVKLVALRIPAYISLTLPMASVLAPLLAFGRLAADNEITALRACGISTLRLALPAFLLFLGVSTMHLFIIECITPAANTKALELMTSVRASANERFPSKEKLAKKPSPQPVVYPQYGVEGLQRLFYASHFDGAVFRNATLVETGLCMKEGLQSQDSSCKAMRLGRLIVSEAAFWDKESTKWVFKNGVDYEFGQFDALNTASTGPKNCLKGTHRFRSRSFRGITSAPLDLIIMMRGKSLKEMNTLEAQKMLNLLYVARNIKEYRRLKVRLHQRLGLPFACTIFGTSGALLSLLLPAELRDAGFALALVIVFCYYMISVVGSFLGQVGILSAIVGAWIPNMVGVCVMIILAMKSSR